MKGFLIAASLLLAVGACGVGVTASVWDEEAPDLLMLQALGAMLFAILLSILALFFQLKEGRR